MPARDTLDASHLGTKAFPNSIATLCSGPARRHVCRYSSLIFCTPGCGRVDQTSGHCAPCSLPYFSGFFSALTGLRAVSKPRVGDRAVCWDFLVNASDVRVCDRNGFCILTIQVLRDICVMFCFSFDVSWILCLCEWNNLCQHRRLRTVSKQIFKRR